MGVNDSANSGLRAKETCEADAKIDELNKLRHDSQNMANSFFELNRQVMKICDSFRLTPAADVQDSKQLFSVLSEMKSRSAHFTSQSCDAIEKHLDEETQRIHKDIERIHEKVSRTDKQVVQERSLTRGMM
jgi:gas vesicle protein